MEQLIAEFAQTVDVDPEAVRERWQGHPENMIEDLFRFPDDEGELHPVKLFRPFQPKFVHAYFYGDATTLTFLKGRRIGGTAIALLCFALEGLMMPGQLYPIIATNKPQAYRRIDDLKAIFKNCVLDVPVPIDNKGFIELWNGTRYVAYTSKPSGARGDGARSILFDEMAFMEKQDEMLRAFRPMMALSQGKMLQVSTINSKNDLFMKSYERGTETGYDEEGKKVGVISLYQPTFLNGDELDVDRSLYEQKLVPARPDLNVDVCEEDRVQDPVGFAQEYLCIPASETVQFFSDESVAAAMDRSKEEGYAHGPAAFAQHGGSLVMSVDLAKTNDETVISVFEHVGAFRYQRYLEAVTEETIAQSGIRNPDRANSDHLADRIADVYLSLGCEHIVIDATGMGTFFDKQLEARIGRGVVSFNFSDWKRVAKMFGSTNAALRTNRITLLDDEALFDQLISIQRIQKDEGGRIKFTGKEESADGRDDRAIATVMSAYPPMFDNADEDALAYREQDRPEVSRKEVLYDGAVAARERDPDDPGFAGTRLNRQTGRRSRTYRSRYSRR